MKKANFNSVQFYGNVHGNDETKTFSVDYFNAVGFVSLAKNQKAFAIAEKLNVEPFENGLKPLVKTLEQKSGNVVLFVGGNGVFAYVETAKETFARKATFDNTIKRFRSVKAIIGKLLRKNDLPKSNMLQTRVCCEKVNL